MTPAFSSWQAFWAMGGYGFYVWLAVFVTLFSLSSLVIHTIVRRKRIFTEIKQRQLREQRIAQAKQVKQEKDK